MDWPGMLMLNPTEEIVNVCGSSPGFTTVTCTVSPWYTVSVLGENAQTSLPFSRPLGSRVRSI
jgi:hypothetical protein